MQALVYPIFFIADRLHIGFLIGKVFYGIVFKVFDTFGACPLSVIFISAQMD